MAGDRSRRPKQAVPPDRRAGRALAELERLVRDLAERGGVEAPTTLELRIDIGAAPTSERAHRRRRLVESIEGALRSQHDAERVWRVGAVYCFLCHSNGCGHATPPSPTDVFAGYAPTGKPGWRGFVDLCVERRVEGLDALFESPPGAVALRQDAEELAGELLPAFGGRSVVWRIRGQVVAGLLDARLTGDERRALALQVVETRPPGAPMRLRLNPVGLDLDALGAAAADGPPRSRAEQLRRAINQARRRVGALGRRMTVAEARGEGLEADEAIDALLGRLRGDLARVLGGETRRTRHAQERHAGGERPTSTAFDDARAASDEQLFADTRRQTIIVLGRRGRAHVFTREGRQVTSLRLRPGELDRKTARARWRPLPSDEARAFRARLNDTE